MLEVRRSRSKGGRLACNATRAVLHEVSLGDLLELRAFFCQTETLVSNCITRTEGAVIRLLRQVGRDARNGIKGLTTLVSSRDALQE